MKKKFKQALKNIVYNNPLFVQLCILIYIIRGRRPWSFGYQVFKFKFISKILDNPFGFLNGQRLAPGYGSRLDERVVEYPWFFSQLKNDAKVILDAGSTLNHHIILQRPPLRGRKLFIATLDNEGMIKTSSIQPSYIYGDLRDLCFKDNYFDSVACLSTLEHVGMDNTILYTSDIKKKENAANDYLKAIDEFKRVLKKRGTLYLTMPFGRYQNHGWFQIFDGAMVENVRKRFGGDDFSEMYFKYKNGQWENAVRRDCEEAVFFDVHQNKSFRSDFLAASEAVVCLALTKA